MIMMDDVSITFGGVRVIKNLCLSIQSGEMALLLGPSESVLQGILYAICGQVTLDDGKIEIDGLSVHSDVARQKMVCVLEKPLINPYLTPRQNLSYYLRLRGIESSVINNLDKHAKRLLLHEFLDTKTSKLGQGLIRAFETLEALIVQPKYFIQSDFTASYPSSYFRIIPSELNMLLKQGSSILSSTPSFKFAQALSNHIPVRVVVLHDEGIIIEGSIKYVENHFSSVNIPLPEPAFGEAKSVEIDRAINTLPER